MPLVNRASIGQEFMDITSAKLLVQPQPQYIYAQLFKMALNIGLLKMTGAYLGMGGDRGVPMAGTPYVDANSGRAIYDDEIYRDAFQVVPELGNKPGHTVRLNRPIFRSSTYTEASREVASGTQISTTPINLASEQVSITCKRLAGPYDQDNSRVAPYGIDRFDASMSVHSLASAVGTNLQIDFDHFIDSYTSANLSLASTTVRPQGFSADTSFSTAGEDGPMDLDTLSRTEEAMSNANLTPFPDGTFALVTHPRAIRQLKNDSTFLKAASFHPPVNPILAKSYYKSIGKLSIFQSTTLPTTTNGGAGTVYRSHAFAPGVIGGGISDLPRAATSTYDNYGEEALVIWLMYGALRNLDNRFCVNVHTN